MKSDTQNRKLILENKQGTPLRTFHWQGEDFSVVSRKDTGRLELHSELSQLDEEQIPYDVLELVKAADLKLHQVSIRDVGHLRLADEISAMTKDVEETVEHRRDWWLSVLLVLMLAFVFTSLVVTRRSDVALETKVKQELVRIVKKVQVQKQKTIEKPTFASKDTAVTEAKVPAKKADAIKRMGALAVLGSLKSGKQKGGLDLGAVNTTAGPGLGGTAGSGGMQTSLYGKGLVAAPLGAGAKMDGGGGYGTKGKGGGKAGYGKLSMVGSSGTQLIPVGTEATTEGGLDMSLISDVVKRNLGQIRFCYEQGLQSQPGLAGRVGVNWVISPEGQVSLANVGSTTMNSKAVEDCIIMRVKSWRFPIPTNGLQVKVTYPFVLNRVGQGAL